MKKILLALFLFIPSIVMCEDSIFTQNTFNGLVDEMSADDIDITNTPDCLNVYFDEYTKQITKRKGSVKDSQNTITGNQWIRSMYDYKKINGDEYIIFNSSCSVWASQGTGTYTNILSGQSPTLTFDYTTAKNYVYGANGSTVFKYDGNTVTQLGVTNSTGIPTTAKYIKYINNRMMFAGMATTSAQIW